MKTVKEIIRYIWAACAVPVFAAMVSAEAMACTSAIVGSEATAHGRALLWKHRDSGHEHNVIDRVEASDSTLAFVALYNAEDVKRREAWIGFNAAGFAVMNTASYNLAPDTATVKDCEGLLMSRALAHCYTVSDFRCLLDTLLSTGAPLGVQANFGVLDAGGKGSYFEVSDHAYTEYAACEAPQSSIIRTNFSFSGGRQKRLGSLRYDDATHLLRPRMEAASVTPCWLTDSVSRSFYHHEKRRDLSGGGNERYIVDKGECIPRRSSCASVVVEIARPDEDPAASTCMWVAIGNPLGSKALRVTLDDIPKELTASGANGHSELCDFANGLRDRIFHSKNKSGKWLIDLKEVRAAAEAVKKHYGELNLSGQ